MKHNNEQIVTLALDLIRAMRSEGPNMPKAYEAPETATAAGVLAQRLTDAGFDIGPLVRKTK